MLQHDIRAFLLNTYWPLKNYTRQLTILLQILYTYRMWATKRILGIVFFYWMHMEIIGLVSEVGFVQQFGWSQGAKKSLHMPSPYKGVLRTSYPGTGRVIILWHRVYVVSGLVLGKDFHFLLPVYWVSQPIDIADKQTAFMIGESTVQTKTIPTPNFYLELPQILIGTSCIFTFIGVKLKPRHASLL